MVQHNMASYPGDPLATVWGTALAAQGGEVVVAGTAEVASSTTLSGRPGAPMSLGVPSGALVQPASGVTLTIDAPITAGAWQIFDLSQGGTVVLGSAAGTVVRPEWYGAVGNGVANDTTALNAMSAALPAGAIVLLTGTYRIVYDGSTAPPSSPPPIWTAADTPTYGIFISQPGVWVVADAGAGIFMDGFTYGTACQYSEGMGIDRYTAISFSGTSGGGVIGVQFTGNGDGTPLFLPGTTTYASRAKGVGITDSSNIVVLDVAGLGLVGNVVNARGDTAVCRHVVVAGCFAFMCCENGFDFMGGTADCAFGFNVSADNGFSGFETGTVGIICTANLCCGNQMEGINWVGSNGLFDGNLLFGNVQAGFAFQGGSTPPAGDQSVVVGNLIYANGATGISVTPESTDNLILLNLLIDNGATSGAYGMELNSTLVNDLPMGVTGFTIAGNLVAEIGVTGADGIYASYASNLSVIDNLFVMTAGYCVSATNGMYQTYIRNVTTTSCSIQGVANLECARNVVLGD